MPTVGFFLRDDAMPRTKYWEKLAGTIRQSRDYRAMGAEVLIPAEDMAMETNWPRYGKHSTAYIRGERHVPGVDGPVGLYFKRICQAAQEPAAARVLYINMNPFFRVSHIVRTLANVIVADVSLTEGERRENPRTISMPAMPIVKGQLSMPGVRPVLASFQGRDSDPVRAELHRVADGKSVIVNLIEKRVHTVDAMTGESDPGYEDLLRQSIFAFVPRGDRHFSYRLLEVMSFGCIPVILSDGWVLPFDRIVGWEEFGVRVRREDIASIPGLLRSFPEAEIMQRQRLTGAAYDAFFASFGKVAAAMLMEVDLVLDSEQAAQSGDRARRGS